MIRMAELSSTHARSSAFSRGAVGPFGGRAWLGRPFLGDLDHPTNNFEWYGRAKAGIERFDLLLRRTAAIANKSVREEIIKWVGSASDTSSPAYRYGSVVSDVKSDVERFTPPNYGAYDVERRRDRVDELWDINGEFKDLVEEAEDFYGVLPEAEIREIIRIEEKANWTLPLIVAGGAIAVAAGVLLFKK